MGRKLTTEEFIRRSKIINGDKFSYDRTVYKNRRSLVTVTCPVHSDFEQNADSHMMGRGCDKCSSTYSPTTEEWVKKTREIREDFYDYSLVDYIDKNTKIKIVCPLHGVFHQTPDNHRQGQNCPNCAKSGFKSGRPGSLYVLGCGDNYTKLGITNRTVKKRCGLVSRDSGLDFDVLLELKFFEGKTALDIETIILRYLRKTYKNIDKTFDGYTETFVDVDRSDLYLKITETFGEIISANKT
jgi:hypothetical protein